MPTWTRRLAVSSDGVTPLLVVSAPSFITSPTSDDHIHPWVEPRTSAVTQIVIPIVDAVELLASPFSPELEIERRAKLCEKHAEEEAAKRKTRAEAEARRVAEEQRAAKERADFKADLWAKLDDLQHFALRLACAVEGKDKALAASLRAVVNQSIQESVAGVPADFPREVWDKGLAWPVPSPRSKRPPLGSFASAATILATIPKERLNLFRLSHGEGPVADSKIARLWLDLQATWDAAAQPETVAQSSPSAGQQAEARARARREQEQNDREMDAATATSSKAAS